MIKTTVGEYEKFYDDNDFWPKDTVIEEDVYVVNGDELSYDEIILLPKHTKIVVDGGFCYVEGNIGEDGSYKDLGSLTSNFNKWKKQEKIELIFVQIDKEKSQELKDFVEKLGGKILK